MTVDDVVGQSTETLSRYGHREYHCMLIASQPHRCLSTRMGAVLGASGVEARILLRRIPGTAL